jgi:hypothetical protein
MHQALISTQKQEIAKYASSVGMLVDRCVRREEPFGTAWLIDNHRVVTCAHLVVLYLEDLTALKVGFPAMNQDWEVKDVDFHPRFDTQVAMELAQRSLSQPVPALALQDHNLAVLTLSRNLSDLTPDFKTSFNKKLSMAPAPRMKGLGGSVDELGLALVIQTMTASRKDGLLVLSDERNRPVAKLFCRDGMVLYAKYGKLINESAVCQMFAQQVTGQFNFQTASKPDWTVSAVMSRSTESLLLESHRRMDEIPKLLTELGGEGSCYARATDILDEPSINPELQAFARRIWPHLDGGVSMDRLWDVVSLDNYTIYSVLGELTRTQQVVQIPRSTDALTPMQPLQMSPATLLAPWDEVTNLTIHPTVGIPQFRQGNLIGLLRPNDPWHLLHSVTLPYQAAGSPIFKGSQVIGMHCGMLPLDPRLHALPQHLHQMLWCESIAQCLGMDGRKVSSRPSKGTGGLVRPSDHDLNKIECPKCKSLMIRHAKFCGTCGNRLP